MAGAGFGMNFRVFSANKCFGNFYDERAAGGHGVACIAGEIHDNLFNHALVGVDERQDLRAFETQLDGFADETVEHLAGAADDLAEVDQAGLHDIFAAGQEQLPRQLRCAVAGGINLRERLLRLGGKRGVREQFAGVALDDRQHVVEIMRDAGGELAEGLHLFRLEQLRLEAQTRGDVLAVAMHHAAVRQRMKRPSQRVAADFREPPGLTMIGVQTFADNLLKLLRQNMPGMFLPERGSELFGGVVEISHLAIRRNFQRRIGIFFHERGQLFRFRLGFDALCGHAYHVGDGQHKLDVIRRKFSQARRMHREHAKGFVPGGNRHGRPADHAEFHQQ